jgi:hypothetical protein
MASSLRELRIKARKLGATNVREMDEDELQEYIEENSSGNGKSRKTKKRGPGRPKGSKNKATKAKKARRVIEEDYDDDDDDDEEEEAPRRRGRPKGSKNKTAKASKRGPGRPKGSGKKASTKKSSNRGVGRPAGSGTGTRVTLKSKINWNKRFDFREGSTSQYILTQVRKSAKKYDDTDDIREDVIEKLENKLGKIDELTFNNRSTGRAHKGAAALKMLRYRVSRTMLDYAIETGQHDGSGNGGSSTKAPAKRGRPKGSTNKRRGPGRPRKVVEEDYEDDEDDDEEEAPRRRGRPKGSKNKKRGPGRPKGSTNKAKTAKRGPGRPKGSGTKKRGPGRPKGSKNKARR